MPRCGFLVLATAICVACARHTDAPEPEPMPPRSATLVTVQTRDPEDESPLPAPLPDTDRERVLTTLNGAAVQATACYERAIERDPYTYGEVVVRFRVEDRGRPHGVTTLLETVGDPELVSCVEGLVQKLRFQAVEQGPLVVRYPFVFTSDLTPPEVVRALQRHYGLVKRAESDPDEDADPIVPIDLGSEAGTVETW